MDFLWHKVSEKEKQEIQEQAKQIMKNFSDKLSKIKDNLEDPSIEKDFGEREEKNETSSKGNRLGVADLKHDQSKEALKSTSSLTGQSKEEKEGKNDENFSREIMFDNAKEKNKDFIIGEKKTW